jgi:hypothetical protein
LDQALSPFGVVPQLAGSSKRGNPFGSAWHSLRSAERFLSGPQIFLKLLWFFCCHTSRLYLDVEYKKAPTGRALFL